MVILSGPNRMVFVKIINTYRLYHPFIEDIEENGPIRRVVSRSKDGRVKHIERLGDNTESLGYWSVITSMESGDIEVYPIVIDIPNDLFEI